MGLLLYSQFLVSRPQLLIMPVLLIR